MPEINPSTDILDYDFDNGPRLSQGLNVLTILTFVGSGIGIIWSVFSQVYLKFMIKIMDKALESEVRESKIADLQKGKHLFELMLQNIVPLVIIGLVGIGACIYGAILMRKLKKDGYWIYLAGEILPIIGTFFFLGKAQYSDWTSVFGLLVPLVFIILYTRQKKYLVK